MIILAVTVIGATTTIGVHRYKASARRQRREAWLAAKRDEHAAVWADMLATRSTFA